MLPVLFFNVLNRQKELTVIGTLLPISKKRNYRSSIMISKNITLGVIAVLAASMLVTWALAASPSYADEGGHKGKREISGNNNTIIVQISKGKAIAQGADTEASNIQSNTLVIKSP